MFTCNSCHKPTYPQYLSKTYPGNCIFCATGDTRPLDAGPLQETSFYYAQPPRAPSSALYAIPKTQQGKGEEITGFDQIPGFDVFTAEQERRTSSPVGSLREEAELLTPPPRKQKTPSPTGSLRRSPTGGYTDPDEFSIRSRTPSPKPVNYATPIFPPLSSPYSNNISGTRPAEINYTTTSFMQESPHIVPGQQEVYSGGQGGRWAQTVVTGQQQLPDATITETNVDTLQTPLPGQLSSTFNPLYKTDTLHSQMSQDSGGEVWGVTETGHTIVDPTTGLPLEENSSGHSKKGYCSACGAWVCKNPGWTAGIAALALLIAGGIAGGVAGALSGSRKGGDSPSPSTTIDMSSVTPTSSSASTSSPTTHSTSSFSESIYSTISSIFSSSTAKPTTTSRTTTTTPATSTAPPTSTTTTTTTGAPIVSSTPGATTTTLESTTTTVTATPSTTTTSSSTTTLQTTTTTTPATTTTTTPTTQVTTTPPTSTTPASTTTTTTSTTITPSTTTTPLTTTTTTLKTTTTAPSTTPSTSTSSSTTTTKPSTSTTMTSKVTQATSTKPDRRRDIQASLDNTLTTSSLNYGQMAKNGLIVGSIAFLSTMSKQALHALKASAYFNSWRKSYPNFDYYVGIAIDITVNIIGGIALMHCMGSLALIPLLQSLSFTPILAIIKAQFGQDSWVGYLTDIIALISPYIIDVITMIVTFDQSALINLVKTGTYATGAALGNFAAQALGQFFTQKTHREITMNNFKQDIGH